MEGAGAGAKAEDSTTVLVTGASGYLGGWCVLELLRRGHRVRATLRDPAREREVRAMLAPHVDVDGRLTIVEADLTRDDGWDDAVAGCEHVLHVASPFPPAAPKDRDALVGPAREGTLRVLRASLGAGVRRVVVTSSSAAAAYFPGSPPAAGITEDDWTDLEHPLARPYVRSKVLAERAAWELMDAEGARERLATVLPGAILGPVLTPDLSYSVQAVERMLNRSMPGIPRLGFAFVDVRDVADLHIRALTAPEAGGERFLATGPFLWLSELAQILRERAGATAARVPTRRVPSLLVRGAALFDPGLRQVVGELDERFAFSNEKAKRVLGWSPRPIEQTAVECAESLVREGVVRGRRAA
jgi:dihydroflavonol-4-reductase